MSQAPRPKTLGVSMHADGGAAFDAACVAAGVSNTAIARLWGVDEAVVRRVRAGAIPLTFERIAASPREVRRALLTAMMAELDEETPRSVAPLGYQALRASGAAGRLSIVVADAEVDGVYTSAELDEIEHAALEAEREPRQVRLRCEELRAAAGGR